MKKTPGAARSNPKRRSLAAKRDGGPPPPSRVKRVKRAFSPRGISAEPPQVAPPVEDLPSSMDVRHLRRYMEAILLETRTTRQYIQWVHEMLARGELASEASLPSPLKLRERAQAAAKKAKEQEKRRIAAFLQGRAARGIGDNGNDLTPDEQARIAAGEPIEDVLDL